MQKAALPVILSAAMFSGASHAAVTWNFNYLDVGVGFDDPTEGAARRNALESAGSYLSGFLTGYNATIDMDVNGAETADTTLAAAGSNATVFSTTAGFNEQGDVMRKILGGNAADPDAATADGTVTWNFQDFQWELGNDFQAGEFDFFSTAVHELTHALGFASSILENGNDVYSNTPGNPGMWAPFDRFLTDFAGVPIIDGSFALDGTRWDASKLSLDGSGTAGCGAGLLFNGANAVAANGGNPVQIYSPNPWEGGSSGSHLDDNCYTTPGNVSTYMMEAQTIDGLGVRTLSALEIGMLRDIGYTQFGVTAQPPTSVPTPAPLWLLSVGLLGLARSRFGKAGA